MASRGPTRHAARSGRQHRACLSGHVDTGGMHRLAVVSQDLADHAPDSMPTIRRENAALLQPEQWNHARSLCYHHGLGLFACRGLACVGRDQSRCDIGRLAAVAGWA